MKSVALLSLSALSLVLASCATQAPAPSPSPAAAAATPATLDAARSAVPPSSPECLALKLKPAQPMQTALIPEDTLRKAQDGFVALRYDLVAGSAQNVSVVQSVPQGLYDAPAKVHAASYRDAGGATVKGCIMTVDIRF